MTEVDQNLQEYFAVFNIQASSIWLACLCLCPLYLQYQRAWLRVLAGPGPAAACSLSDSTFTTVRRHTRHWAAQLIRPPHPQPTAARTDNSGFGNIS